MEKIVNIDIAGKLSNLISDWEKENIEELTIIGEMNGSDFKIIRDMATNNQLYYIDLSETNIVNGGDYYDINYSTKHYTKNDEFGYSLFNGCEKFKKIILPKTIKEIGQCAFWYCSNLKTLVINSKVISIKPGIWGGCNKLDDIQIIDNANFHFENNILYDKNYTKIIAALQTGCYGDLSIKKGIKEIQYNAFSDCEFITNAIFPSSLTEIGDCAFSHSGITSVTFNKNLEIIRSFAFSGCHQLKEINLIEVKIETLEYGTFSYCRLEVIYLPKGLKEMKEIVFANNPLKHIFCYSNNPSTFFDFSTKKPTFQNLDIKNCIVHIPKGKINIYKEAKGWSNFDSIIDDINNMPDIQEDSVTIEKKTVNIDIAGKLSNLISDWEKENIEELTIIGEMNGSDFKIIRDMATNNQLYYIDLSETNIVNGGDYYDINYSTKHYTKNDEFGYSLFNGCEKFKKIILPKTIKEIGQCAFWYCSNLKTLVINSKVISIKPGIWGGCNKLDDIQIIDNANFHFENNILYDKNYTKIIAALQTGCYGDLSIKKGIKEIQYNAFSDCEFITNAIFPSSLTEIGDCAFSHSGITSVTFNKNLEIIRSFAFSGCHQLKEINLIEVKIETLEYGTFSYCRLEVIYLPKGLKEMKEIVFANNPLKHIFCYSNNPSTFFDFSTKKPTFQNLDIKNCIVHIPKGKINIYKEAKGWSNFDSIIDDLK